MRRAKSALLWGVAGTLTFLVLAGGYRLAIEDFPVGLAGAAAGAVAVGVVVAVVAYYTENRLTRKGRT